MTKTEAERREFLSSLNLNAEAPALEQFDRPIAKATATHIQWAAEGADPHTMPITDIAFDPEMVEQFPDLSPRGRSAASRFLFDQYKSYGRDKDRNSLLHRRIGEFLAQVHRTRETGGGFVKDKIALANTFAEQGITAEDVEGFIAWKRGQEEGK